MQRKILGTSDLDISRVCLGTMTFGNQTDEADAHRQIDMALAAGIDFLDTAEMYPVNPVRAETVGRTEEIIGRWITATGSPPSAAVATATERDAPTVTPSARRPSTVTRMERSRRLITVWVAR